MDYTTQSRIKIWGTADFVEDDPEVLQRVVDPDYPGRPERVLVFHVKAWGPNCTQHIKQRFTVEEMGPIIQQLRQRIAELEENNASLKKQLGQSNFGSVGRELSVPAEASGK